MSDPARDLLAIYNFASLQQMARQDGVDGKGKNKEALIDLLAPSLFDADRIGRALADLGLSERALLDELRLLGGSAPTMLLYRRLLESGTIAKAPLDTRYGWNILRRLGGSPWKRDSKQFGDVVARLGVLRLAFSADEAWRKSNELGEPGPRTFIPAPILEQVPLPEIPVELAPEPDVVQAAPPETALRDLYELTRAAAESPIPLTARGQIAKRALVRLNQNFRVQEDVAAVRSEDELERLPFLRSLAEDLRLLEVGGGTLVPGPSLDTFLSLPPPVRLQRLVEEYRATRRWCELDRVPGLTISERGGPSRGTEAVFSARQRVIQELIRLPVDRWIAGSHFVARLKRVAVDLLFPNESVPRRYLEDEGNRDSVYDGNNPFGWTFQGDHAIPAWEDVEGGIVGQVVRALHWLGLLDLGEGTASGPVFRVSPTGLLLLQGGDLPKIEEAPDVVVQPNFQVFAFPPTGEEVLFQLDQFAERVKVDQAVEYRLTRESVYRAQKRDVGTAEIIAFLERVSRTPLPQNVRFTLEEWGEQHERIVVRRGAAILHLADAAALDALYADAQVGPLLGRRAAPTVALVASSQLASLGALLRQRGKLPAWEEGSTGTPRPELQIDARGRVAFARPPSIFVLRAVRNLSEERSNGHDEINRASLRRAAREGWTADDVLAILSRYHRGPLPDALREQIRASAKNWGSGALATASLLQVESPEILAELLADPELRPHLTALSGAPTLAVVHPNAVAKVRTTLAERGMALGNTLRAIEK